MTRWSVRLGLLLCLAAIAYLLLTRDLFFTVVLLGASATFQVMGLAMAPPRMTDREHVRHLAEVVELWKRDEQEQPQQR
jgi:hypothetical protein